MTRPSHPRSACRTRDVPLGPLALLVARGTGRRRQEAVFGCNDCSEAGGCRCLRAARAFAAMLGVGTTIVRDGVVIETVGP